MDLKEAYEKADESDLLKRENWMMSDGFCAGKLTGRGVRGYDIIANDWEIVKPEPKVLTADQFLFQAEICHACRHAKCFTDNQIFDAGHKNGRLEMWLEFKRYLDDKEYNRAVSFELVPLSLEKAIDDLKPLN